MEKINIICVDDQREVLRAVLADLTELKEMFQLEECESAAEVLALVEELDSEGEFIGLIISDHVMPEKSGVELLSEIAQDSRFLHTKKILLTGQATHADTINAINLGHIDRYIEKPWQPSELVAVVRTLLTHYIFDKGIDHQPFQDKLDLQIVFARLSS